MRDKWPKDKFGSKTLLLNSNKVTGIGTGPDFLLFCQDSAVLSGQLLSPSLCIFLLTFCGYHQVD